MLQETFERLEWETLLSHYSSHCQSIPGKEAAIEIVPAEELSTAQRWLEETHQARIALDKAAPGFLAHLPQMREVLLRLQKEVVLDGRDLLAILKLSTVNGELKQFFKEPSLQSKCPLLATDANLLADLSPITKPIAWAVDELGKIRDSASPELRSLRDQERKLHSEARDRIDAIVQQHFRDGYLQDRFFDQRGGRYLVPVKAEFKNKVAGSVVESSSSRATLFMEPHALRQIHEQIRQVELSIEEEVFRILQELSAKLFPKVQELELSYRVALKFDLVFGRAQFANFLATVRGISKPEFTDNFYLDHLYHPLLSYSLPAEKIVRNTFRLGPDKKILVISGPNTGGKTVILKAVGLSCIMSRAGFFLPCAGEAKIPFFRTVLAQIGDSQNIELSLSSFSGSIEQLREILAQAGPSCIVLIDEILHATDPDEAVALSRALLSELQNFGAYSVVTTHLNGLKVLKESWSESASMEFDTESLSPTYRLRIGIPGSSRALEIAQKLGLPKKIIDLARSFLSTERLQEQRAVDQLEKKEKELEVLRQQVAEQSIELEADREKFAKLHRQMENVKQNFRRDALQAIHEREREVLDKLEKIYATYRSKIQSLEEKHEAAESLNEEVSQVKKDFALVRTKVTDIVPQIEGTLIAETEEAPEKTFAPGKRFFLKTMNMEVSLVNDRKDKKAIVLLGNMRKTVAWDDLSEIIEDKTGIPSQTGFRPQRKTGVTTAELETNCPEELNLLGKAGDDALQELQHFIDQATRSGRAMVRIVHGHGGGILKKLVRSFLKDSSYDLKFRAGTPQEGGDGCTVVEFF